MIENPNILDKTNSPNDIDKEESLPNSKNSTTQTSNKRYFMLLIFSLNTFVNGAMFMGLSAISDIAASYYEVPISSIHLLSNIFMLMYVFMAFPVAYLITKYGVKPILTLASCFQALGAFFQYFGREHNRYWCIAAGQILAGIAYAGIIQLGGQISADWFPVNERPLSTAISTFMNIFGVAIGFIQPTETIPAAVKEKSKIQFGISHFFLTRFVVIAAVFLLSMFYEESSSKDTKIEKQNTDFIAELQSLSKNCNFLIFSQGYGLYFGLIVTYMVVLSTMVTSVHPVGYQTTVGWMGVSNLLISIVSTFLLGLFLGKFHQHRLVAILLNAFSAFIWLLFVVFLTERKDINISFVIFTLFGVTSIPFFATGIDQAAEITHPTPEIISSTVILFFGNSYGGLFLMVLGTWAANTKLIGYTIFCLYLVSTLIAFLSKSEFKRTNAISLN